MERLLFILTCLLATGSHDICMGQNNQHTKDSLLLVLNTAREDTNKVKTLISLCEKYRALGELENSKKYGEEALRLAEKINFKHGKIFALINTGILQYQQGEYTEALKNYFTALQISRESGNKRGISNCYQSIAVIYDAQGNFTEALKNYADALKIFVEIKDSTGIARCYSNIGNVYDNQGNYPDALESYFTALKIAEEIGDKMLVANVSVNIGVVYWHQDSYEEALKAQFSALTIMEEFENKRGISMCYANIGMVYTDQNNLEKAKEYNLKSLAIDEELGDITGIAINNSSIGNVCYKQSQFPDAMKYYTKALTVFQEIGDTLNTAILYLNLGRTYEKLKQFSEAALNMDKGLVLANAIGAKHAMREMYKYYTLIYKNQNDFKNAYKYHDLYYQMNDSIFNEAKSQQIAELKVAYETEKKESEIALLNTKQELHLAEIKKQKILKFLFMGGLALAAFLVFFGYKFSRNSQALKVLTMRNKIASDLHDDVGSSLTSIRLYSEIGKKQTTDPGVIGVLDKIGQNVGEVIQSMGDIVWMINPKYDAFGSVFSRMENFASEMLSPLNIQYTIKKDNEVEALKFSMSERQNIFMIFKEAIHNAAKHAHCKTVAIHLSRNKDHLQMNITDDGSGFDDLDIQHGNGLSNMKSRAAEINGTITVSASVGNGTSVTLNMLV